MPEDTAPEFAPWIKMHHATRAKAARLDQMLKAEYPRLEILPVEGEPIDHEKYTHGLQRWEIVVDGEETILQDGQVPELADILEACAQQEIDPSAVEEPEEEVTSGHSRVPVKYKIAYREASSTGQGNGDWLYETLAAWTLTPDGKDIVALDLICRNNGIDPDHTKWGQARITESRGWKGRYAMSARIALEKPLCITGVLRDPAGEAHPLPADFLEALRTKHDKWLRKAQRKAEAEAQPEAEEA